VISAVLLAAGAARRFGGPKLLEPLGGKPIVRWSAEALLAHVDELIAVVPPEAEALRAALDGLPARFVVNPEPHRGMASSIVAGVRAVDARSDATLLALGDEPTIDRATVASVIERFRAGGASIVLPAYDEAPEHPVLFERSTLPELLKLTGDRGARAVIDADPRRVAIVGAQGPRPADIDTPADLARLRDAAQFSTPPIPKPT
jgi:molybdenum cofactor cytidylyltransferase